MPIPSPTQSTPGGCVIGLLAVIPATFFGFGIWGLVKWLRLPTESQHVNTYFWTMLGVIVAGALCTGCLVWVAYRLIRSADFRGYDSRDPDNTNMKW